MLHLLLVSSLLGPVSRAAVPVRRLDPLSSDEDRAPTSPLTGELPQLPLRQLCRAASTVVVGKVVSARVEANGTLRQAFGQVLVQEALRGDPSPSIEVHTNAVEVDDDKGVAPREFGLVEGYTLLLFLDDSGGIFDGGMFYVEAGWAWRRKRAGIFLSPRSDRVWDQQIDPSSDYDAIEMDEVRDAVEHIAYRRRAARRAARKQRHANAM